MRAAAGARCRSICASPCSAPTTGSCPPSSTWRAALGARQVSFLAVDVVNAHAFGRAERCKRRARASRRGLARAGADHRTHGAGLRRGVPLGFHRRESAEAAADSRSTSALFAGAAPIPRFAAMRRSSRRWSMPRGRVQPCLLHPRASARVRRRGSSRPPRERRQCPNCARPSAAASAPNARPASAPCGGSRVTATAAPDAAGRQRPPHQGRALQSAGGVLHHAARAARDRLRARSGRSTRS